MKIFKITILALLINNILVVNYINNINDKNKIEINAYRKLIKDQTNNIKQKNDVIRNFYNYSKRIQLLAGVDTLDNVFTFEEKLKNPIKIRCLLP